MCINKTEISCMVCVSISKWKIVILPSDCRYLFYDLYHNLVMRESAPALKYISRICCLKAIDYDNAYLAFDCPRWTLRAADLLLEGSGNYRWRGHGGCGARDSAWTYRNIYVYIQAGWTFAKGGVSIISKVLRAVSTRFSGLRCHFLGSCHNNES
jgi:hypothetical protein